MKRKSLNDKVRKRDARKSRVRKRMSRTDRTALTVYRTSKHIYALLVDIQSGRTITSVSTRSKEIVGDAGATGTVDAAKKVGAALAAAARALQGQGSSVSERTRPPQGRQDGSSVAP
jgi:large subunit ribosomal protein L18